jgi:hypothetical protein
MQAAFDPATIPLPVNPITARQPLTPINVTTPPTTAIAINFYVKSINILIMNFVN